MKKIRILLTAAFLFLICAVPCLAAPSYSDFWFQDGNGNWRIHDGSGNIVSNAWLCDDAVPANGKNIWYLIDANGDMISAGLVQDGTGNYYSIETNHDGYFGMLRYESGQYSCSGTAISLSLESSHNGAFAAVKNEDGIAALKEKYGLTKVNIDNSNIVYTSSFGQVPVSDPKKTVGELTEADFIAAGDSVRTSDLLSYLKNTYINDSAVYFYYDSYADPSREGVVKTARGITLAGTKQDVIAAYGEGTAVSMADPANTKAIQIAYRKDPNGIANYAKSCLRYTSADGQYSMYFCFKENGQLSYIFYYIA